MGPVTEGLVVFSPQTQRMFPFFGNLNISFFPRNFSILKIITNFIPKLPCGFQVFSQALLTRKEWAFQKTRGVQNRAEEGHQSDWCGWKLGNCQGLGSTTDSWTCRDVLAERWEPCRRGLWTLSCPGPDSLILKSTPSPLTYHYITSASPCEYTSPAAL